MCMRLRLVVRMCMCGCGYVCVGVHVCVRCVCVRKEGAKIVVETFFFFFQVFRTNEAAEASIETKNFSFRKKIRSRIHPLY